MDNPQLLERRSPRGRALLFGVTLGSGVAILDGGIVNVALPTIGKELSASTTQLQWVVTGYLLTLASFVLAAGSLGDRAGRRKVYLIGVAWFALASAMCALATSPTMLITGRLIQGIGAALLTPGALALIQASFRPEDRAGAIGWWSGASGIGGAAGPLLGGVIVDNWSWKWIFLINVPLCVVVVVVTRLAAPESRGTKEESEFDIPGTVASAIALATATYALTTADSAPRPLLIGLWLVAVAAAAAFIVIERRSHAPLVPLTLFSDRVFSAANAMTFVVYGALGVLFFILVLQLQVTSGWSAFESGLAALPTTIAMLLFSAKAGEWSAKVGPRIPMTLGPAIGAVGIALLIPVGKGSGWLAVLPGMILFSIGLALMVAPLTAAVLASAPTRFAGAASGINNAVARTGSLFAVAAIPTLAGLSGSAYQDPTALTSAYRISMIACVVLLGAGAALSWVGVPAGPLSSPDKQQEPAES